MSYSKTTWTDGVTPLSAANLNKLENGLADIIASSSKSATSGWFSVDGFIVQFGTVALDANGTATFPIEFPTSCVSVSADTVGGSTYQRAVASMSKTGFTVICSRAFTWRYIAIGY